MSVCLFVCLSIAGVSHEKTAEDIEICFVSCNRI